MNIIHRNQEWERLRALGEENMELTLVWFGL